MRDQTFQGVINVIPVLIILVSVLLPFAANGWDVGRTVLPANPFTGTGSNIFAGIGETRAAVSQGGPVASIQGSGVTEDGTRYYLEVKVRNPLPMEVVVKEFSATAPVGGTRVNIAMVRSVTIPSGGSDTIRLEGPVVKGSSLRGSALPAASDLSNLKMVLSSGGVDMNLDENAIRGMLS